MTKTDELIKLVEGHKDMSSQLKQFQAKKKIQTRINAILDRRKRLCFLFPLKRLRISLNQIQTKDDILIIDKAIRNIGYNISIKAQELDKIDSEIAQKIQPHIPAILGLCDVSLFRERDHTDEELKIRQIWLRYEAEKKDMAEYEHLLLFQTIINLFASNQPKQPYDVLDNNGGVRDTQ